jgi:hypothetical protein
LIFIPKPWWAYVVALTHVDAWNVIMHKISVPTLFVAEVSDFGPGLAFCASPESISNHAAKQATTRCVYLQALSI